MAHVARASLNPTAVPVPTASCAAHRACGGSAQYVLVDGLFLCVCVTALVDGMFLQARTWQAYALLCPLVLFSTDQVNFRPENKSVCSCAGASRGCGGLTTSGQHEPVRRPCGSSSTEGPVCAAVGFSVPLSSHSVLLRPPPAPISSRPPPRPSLHSTTALMVLAKNKSSWLHSNEFGFLYASFSSSSSHKSASALNLRKCVRRCQYPTNVSEPQHCSPYSG